MRADGTQEMTTQVSNPQAGGILQRIFGNLGAESKEEPEVVVQEAQVVEDPKDE